MTTPGPNEPSPHTPKPTAEVPTVESLSPLPVAFRGAGKRFGQDWVVRNLDLGVAEGSIVGLIGPSGSGKTTTVRLATGAYKPDEGDVTMLGTPSHLVPRKERSRVGYLPQEPVLFEELSLWGNLSFHAGLNGVRFRRRKRLKEVLDLVELGGDRRKLVRQASGGMKRRLALAAVLAHQPPILFLDEPTAGIDPVLRRRFWEHFRNLRAEGRTFVITTQYVGEAADCDQVVLLSEGRMVAVGAPEQLRRQAFGGDVLEVETSTVLTPAIVQRVASLDGVHSAETTGSRRIRVVVDDGGARMAPLLETLRSEGLEITDSEEVVAPYDDVFIALVERNRADIEEGARPDPEVDDQEDGWPDTGSPTMATEAR